MARRLAVPFERFDQAELGLCRYLNRTSEFGRLGGLCRAVSWLGEDWLWYGLILGLMWLHGRDRVLPAVHMAVTGAAAVVIYKLIKYRAVRERPFTIDQGGRRVCRRLDRYSFPSVHTLYAVSFTLPMTHYRPRWFGLLAAFTVLIALWWLILGLHYPSDVAAGGLLGGRMALGSLRVWPQLTG